MVPVMLVYWLLKFIATRRALRRARRWTRTLLDSHFVRSRAAPAAPRQPGT